MAKKYFVTGATGAIGSALIPLLLEEPSSHVWLLMRAESREHLKTRLEELISFWDIPPPQSQDFRSRITPLLGDSDQTKFALSNQEYTEIANQCTNIIHCAGVVRMNLPLNLARQHALSSAKNIVELGVACQASGTLQKIEYVSTVGVAGKMTGFVPETWITIPREFHNTYEQSKAEAENYLHEQIERHHLPVTVHRPSMVVGDSKTGKIIHHQIFYHICEFLAGRRTFGILPNLGKACLDTVPIDYVAGVIAWSAKQQDTIGKIMHLCAGAELAIQLASLQKLVRHLFEEGGYKLPILVTLPPSMFKIVLKTWTPWLSEKTQRVAKTFPFFLDYLDDQQKFSNTETIKLTQCFSLEPPNVINYIEIALKAYLRGCRPDN